jgi:hypothetical protein
MTRRRTARTPRSREGAETERSDPTRPSAARQQETAARRSTPSTEPTSRHHHEQARRTLDTKKAAPHPDIGPRVQAEPLAHQKAGPHHHGVTKMGAYLGAGHEPDGRGPHDGPNALDPESA